VVYSFLTNYIPYAKIETSKVAETLKETNMNYRKYHDQLYKSWNPEYHAVHARSRERGIVIVLMLVVAALTLIFG
jgi:coproporphyrinogen III oxidase